MPPRFLRRLIYGGGTRFRDYERVCLDALMGALSSETRNAVSRQLEALWLIQRFADDMYTALNLEQLDDAALFRDLRPGVRVAKVRFRAEDRAPVTATLVVDRGRISSLEFDRSPTRYKGSAVRVERVDVLADPMVVPEPEPAPQPGPAEIPGLPLAVRGVFPPRAPEELARFLAGLGTATPPDYAELLARADGFIAGHWEFLGTRVRLLKTDIAYIVAADHMEGSELLCFEEGAVHGEVIAYDALDDDVRGRYTSFIDAMTMAGLSDRPRA